MTQFLCNKHLYVKEHTKQKVVRKFAAADANLGNKKVQAVLVKVSIRSPQWKGGGIVFGPTPRSYAYKLPKKVRRLSY